MENKVSTFELGSKQSRSTISLVYTAPAHSFGCRDEPMCCLVLVVQLFYRLRELSNIL